MGAKAALAVLDAKADTAPCVICLDGNKITERPLMECVEKVTYTSLTTTMTCSFSLLSRSRFVILTATFVLPLQKFKRFKIGASASFVLQKQ